MLSACPHVSDVSLLLPSLTGSSMCDPVPHGSVLDESTAGHCTMSGQLYWWTVVYGVDLMPVKYLSTGIIEDYEQKRY